MAMFNRTTGNGLMETPQSTHRAPPPSSFVAHQRLLPMLAAILLELGLFIAMVVVLNVF
jgi:hypothetical protein